MSLRDDINRKRAPRALACALEGRSLARCLAAVVLLAILLTAYNLFLASYARAETPPDGQVTYPAKDFEGGKAKFYSLKTPDGIAVCYFILKSKDGSIRAAFDACDVCWPSGKGYEQEGDDMVCRNCGRHFASVQVGQIRGGCNPGPLTVKLEGGKVILGKAEILDGRHYFDLR